MEYTYRVYVQLFDATKDRFWFGTFSVESTGALSRNEINDRVEQMMYQQFKGERYEALVSWLANNFWDYDPTIQAVYVTE